MHPLKTVPPHHPQRLIYGPYPEPDRTRHAFYLHTRTRATQHFGLHLTPGAYERLTQAALHGPLIARTAGRDVRRVTFLNLTMLAVIDPELHAVCTVLPVTYRVLHPRAPREGAVLNNTRAPGRWTHPRPHRIERRLTKTAQPHPSLPA